MRRFFGLLLILAVAGQIASGASSSDSTKIFYRVGHRQVDVAYRDNASRLDSLLATIRRVMADGDLVRVDVKSQSSPDGELAANERLAINRAIAMKEWIVKNAHVSADSVRAESGGIAWNALRHMVAVSDMDGRDEVLAIIDTCPVVEYDSDGNLVRSRLGMMKQLRGGRPYRVMYDTMFPELRNSLTASVVTIDPYGVSAPGEDAVRLSYRLDETAPDMGRRSNREGYERIVEEVTRRRAAGQEVEVDVTHYATPGEVDEQLKALGDVRVRNLSESLVSDTSAPESIFALYDGGEGWAELRRVIEASQSIEGRDEILAIIDGDYSGRLQRLKEHRQGATWAFLCDEIFPMMRQTVTVTIGTPEAVAAMREADERINGVAARRIDGRTEPVAPREAVAERSSAVTAAGAKDDTAVAEEASDRELCDSRWALKTNFLYDAVLAPSVEVEYRFNDKWSAALDYEMAWWKNSSKNKIYEVAVISPEVRRWVSAKSPWHGHYVGAFPGFTWYDLENGGTGHRGHAFFAGVSYGYMFPIGRSLSLEAGIGVGYMNLRYKDYEPRDGHHVYQRTKSTSYFGPLKARLSLVWRIGSTKATKKTQNR